MHSQVAGGQDRRKAGTSRGLVAVFGNEGSSWLQGIIPDCLMTQWIYLVKTPGELTSLDMVSRFKGKGNSDAFTYGKETGRPE